LYLVVEIEASADIQFAVRSGGSDLFDSKPTVDVRLAVVAGEQFERDVEDALSRNSIGSTSKGSSAFALHNFKKRRPGVSNLDRLARISAGATKNLADCTENYTFYKLSVFSKNCPFTRCPL
jgi:hypothetical protein